MIKQSKKGFTLVELIICCAIMVLLAGACTSVLASSVELYSTGSDAAITQMDVSLVQSSLLEYLPSAKGIQSVTVDELNIPENAAALIREGTALYFNDEDVFTIWHNGKATTVQEVSDFEYTVFRIGTGEKARTQFNYTATFKNGAKYNGGHALSTLVFDTIKDSFAGGTDTVTVNLNEAVAEGAEPAQKKAVLFVNTGADDEEADA